MKEMTGCGSLDGLMGGGFEKGALSLLYGEAGSGKTNICLVMSKNVGLSGRKVLFIDTEGVSIERLHQICGDDLEKVRRNMIVFTPYSFEEQEAMVDEVGKIIASSKGQSFGLVILDSATVYFRMKLHDGETGRGPHSSLSYQIVKLLTAARKHDIPVIVTSQVYMDVDTDTIRPLGGNVLAHNAKTIIHLEKVDTRKRRATIRKHRSLAEGTTAFFIIDAKGLAPWPPVEGPGDGLPD